MQKQIEIEYIAQQKKTPNAILIESTTGQKYSRNFNTGDEAKEYIKPYKKGDIVFITSSLSDVKVGDKTFKNNIIEHISFKEPDGYVPTSKPSAVSSDARKDFPSLDVAIERYSYVHDILKSMNLLYSDEQARNSQIATILINGK